MKFSHFCCYHLDVMRKSESEAHRSWNGNMRRGSEAYVECKTQAACIYLGAAHEAALLRSQCDGNEWFGYEQIIQPMNLIFELLMTEDAFTDAHYLIEKTREFAGEKVRVLSLENTLKEYENRIVAALRDRGIYCTANTSILGQASESEQQILH